LTGGNFGQITDNAILMPVISTMRGDSTLSIADGETVVMGGLLSHSRIKVEDRTPVLSSIPLIGRFFESEAYTSVQDAFVILITVRLMDPAGEPINPR
jgi:type II secretory pathway component GspD/PulD (secretin)